MDSPSEPPLHTNLLSTYFCRIHHSLSALKEHPQVRGRLPAGVRR